MKKDKLKISKIILIAGIAMLALGVIMLCVGFGQHSKNKKEHQKAEAQYEAEYDQWREDWLAGNADMSDQPKMTDYIAFGPNFPAVGIVGAIISFISLAPIGIGLTPFFTKMGAKMRKETLDYAGEDISAAGVKTVEVAKPIIEKGGEVVTPIIGNIVGASANAIENAKSKNTRICKLCNSKVNSQDIFCPKCGNRLED